MRAFASLPFDLAFERARAFDRPLMVVAAILLAAGIVFSLAASPAASAQVRADEAFRFALRQSAFALLGALVIFIVAHAEVRSVRRAGVVLFALMAPACLLVGLFAPEVRGAARWLPLGPFSFQPSELMKPGLVIVWAWMLSEGMRVRGFPGWQISLGLLGVVAVCLLVQPDLGQTALAAFVLAPMLLMAGVRLRYLLGVALLGIFGAVGAYFAFPHARERIAGFLDPSSDAGYQVSRALDAVRNGGVFGQGPGEGVIKRSLPDAHADFVYAVAAEEYGLFASLGLIGVFGFLAFRAFSRAARLVDPFAQLAAAGLAALMSMQAAIHIAVNLGLAPAKGMTLPLVSYGGSSMLGAAITMGFLLALTRARPGAYVFEGRGQ